jgi:hypothetical protein
MSDLNIIKDDSGFPTYIPPETKETYSATLGAGDSSSVVAPLGSKYLVVYYGNLNVRISLDVEPGSLTGSFAKGPGTVARNGFPVKPGQTVWAKNDSTDPAVVSFEFYTSRT